MQIYHKPIMVKQLLDFLTDFRENLTVDCTLGEGGHSEQVLKHKSGAMIGIEQDAEILQIAKERLSQFKDRISFVHDNFHNLHLVLRNETGKVTGIYFDLGSSSYHYDKSGRGFTFRKDEPLDMRMDQRNKLTAADYLNTLPYEKLCQVLWGYGEERYAKNIARHIVNARKEHEIRTTFDLVAIVERAVPRKPAKIHVATKTFQAFRILVNNELNIIEDSIRKAVRTLRVGGRIGVISFHSLEDRIVKETFRELAADCVCPPGQPVCNCQKQRSLKVLTKKPIIPDAQEIKDNPRSRSAKLRVAEKVDGTQDAH
jgi:16S rRNA (cytosine1402-N4)-methyltransferase